MKKTLGLSALSLLMALLMAFVVTLPDRYVSTKGFGNNIASNYFNETVNTMLFHVTGTRGTYSLPYDMSPAPVPAKENFTQIEEDGVKKQVYQDETISVVCWKEKRTTYIGRRACPSEFAFADVRIADASQFRRGWAGANPKNPSLLPPTTIFNNCHGVVGISADFYSFRKYGIIYQYGEEILNRRSTRDASNDVLVVDYEGNFHIYDSLDMEQKIQAEGASFTDTIMFSFTFGPALVENSENTHSTKFTTQRLGEVFDHTNNVLMAQARSCIGQIGPLHYLLCTVGHIGTDMESLADIMVEKGCVTAYNFDGGQSGTLLFQNGHYNTIAYNQGSKEKYGERAQDNIIYFGTAKR